MTEIVGDLMLKVHNCIEVGKVVMALQMGRVLTYRYCFLNCVVKGNSMAESIKSDACP